MLKGLKALFCVSPETLYNNGYSYVAKELLSTMGDQTTIERLDNEAYDEFDPNEFNEGMKAALLTFGKLGGFSLKKEQVRHG